MAEIKFENSRSDPLSDALPGITRRELLKKGGKVAAVAAVSSVFSPFFIHSARAATKTLSFWQFYAPNGISNLQSKWFVDCVAAWNATHDVKIDLQYVPNNDYMNGSKLQTAFASGKGPDIFIISPGDFLRYANGGVLTELTPYMEEEAKKDFFPNVMETRMVDGKIYGLPMEVEPMAMYYSVKAFQEAGLSETDIPKTWDQYLEIARKRLLDITRPLPGIHSCGKEGETSQLQTERRVRLTLRAPCRRSSSGKTLLSRMSLRGTIWAGAYGMW
jgi:multiple sugar transport system substrate-binding protein